MISIRVWPILSGGIVHALSDRTRIARGFHRHAGEYDRHASVQKRVVAHLVQMVDSHLVGYPGRILDIGCGTGALLAALHKRHTEAQLCGIDLAFNMSRHASELLGGDVMIVNGDAGQLPFGAGVFDLVVSASTFQWVQDLKACFDECRRVLRPGGLLCAAFFGGKTLQELQESYREALTWRIGGSAPCEDRLHRFRTVDEVRKVLEGIGFDQVVIAADTEMEYHADVPDLLRSIKGVGASTSVRNVTGSGLGSRGILTEMAKIYRTRFQDNGVIPATYEVIYVVATVGG